VLRAAAVLVALGEHGVALEDEQPGVAVGVEEGIEAEVGNVFRALERERRCGLLHPAGRSELVHAAPDLDQAPRLEEEVFVRGSKNYAGEED